MNKHVFETLKKLNMPSQENMKLIDNKRIELEQEAISSLLKASEKDLYIAGEFFQILSSNDFKSPKTTLLAKVIERVFHKHHAISMLLVAEELMQLGDADSKYSTILAELPSYGFSTFGTHDGVQSIALELKRISTIENVRKEIHDLYEYTAYAACDLDYLLSNMEQVIHKHNYTINKTTTQKEAAIKAFEDGIHGKDVIKTPWKNLNTLFEGGFIGGEYIILAARPSTGKTAFARSIAKHVAQTQNDKAVLFVTKEVTAPKLVQRMTTETIGKNLFGYRDRSITDQQIIEELQSAIQEIEDLPIYYLDTTISETTPSEIERVARSIPNLGVIIVDYLQLISADPNTNKNYNREQEISSISSKAKTLAKKLNIPAIWLAQINRKTEDNNRPPRMSDLRESGAIEQDADIVIFLHTDIEERDKINPTLQVIVAKSRDTRTGTVNLRFDKAVSSFTEITYDELTKQETSPHLKHITNPALKHIEFDPDAEVDEDQDPLSNLLMF